MQDPLEQSSPTQHLLFTTSTVERKLDGFEQSVAVSIYTTEFPIDSIYLPPIDCSLFESFVQAVNS